MKKLIAIILILLVPSLIGAQITYLTGPGTTNIQGFNTNGLIGYWKLGTNYSGSTILGNYGSDPPNMMKSGTTIEIDPEYGPVRYFDGIDDYLFGENFDDEQGVLSYQGNDTTTAEFRDAGQDFGEWISSQKARYMLVVTNSDSTVSWGYCEASDQATDINVYADIDLTIRGWKGTAPVAGSKTPSTYAIRRTNFQITGNLTIGAWIKANNLGSEWYILTKDKFTAEDRIGSFNLFRQSNNKIRFQIFKNMTSSVIRTSASTIDMNWHLIVGVYNLDDSIINVYMDGEIDNGWSSGSFGAIHDTFRSFMIGTRENLTQYWNGQIADAFICNRALSATEIKHIYDHPPRIVTTVR